MVAKLWHIPCDNVDDSCFRTVFRPVHGYHLKAQTINSSARIYSRRYNTTFNFRYILKWVLSVKFLLNCTRQLNAKFFFVAKRGLAFFQLSPVHLFARFSRLGKRSQLILAGSISALFPLCDSFVLFQEDDQQFRYIALELCEATLQEVTFYWFRLAFYLSSVSLLDAEVTKSLHHPDC